ncbi:MAG TPA: hypothetical protein VD767_09480 [Thermomicrobiales bacterium]|nr:hypothetical protein [Thermomicrobiales bacterium]
MIRLIRIFLTIETLLFAFAASAHFSLVGDRGDPAAGGFETLIAIALAAGLVTSFIQPQATLIAARVSQGFALILTLVGFTLVLTVGPTTTFDVTMHLTMLATLVAGLVVTTRAAGGRNKDADLPGIVRSARCP